MANKIIKLGEQTTNLLSNDNLIVYSDISMKSKFNANATSNTTCPFPVENEYFSILATELSNSDYIQEEIVVSSLANLNQVSCLLLHGDDSYVKDYMRYVNKQSLSKFKLQKNINVKAVQNSLHNIFTWIPGERILNPEFGSVLYKHLYSGITDYNTEQIIAEIGKCISEWEPRVQLEEVRNVSNVDDTENNTIHLEIVYSIPSLTNEQYTYTYVYHKQSI